MPIPCAVELCPAYASLASKFCAAHQHAKKLASVHKGRCCNECHRVLREGDYVTVESDPAGRMVHAQCPKRAEARRRRGVETPLFDEA